MDEMKLLEAIGAIDDVVLKKALSYRPSTCSADVANFSSTKEKKNTTRKKSKRNIWIKWVSIAACFCLLFVSSFVLIANFVTNPSTEGFVIEDKVLISYTGNDKNVVIPDNVVTIADYAFKEGGNAEIVETITLGKKVSTVGTYAFDGCVNLKAVKLSEKNDVLKTKNQAVLSADGKQLIYLNASKDITSYTVPNGVERIGSYAFVNSKLTELIFPDSVTTLDSLAVIFNDTLEKISLGGVVEISERAFYNNIALKTVELPKATVIGEAAFSGCSALESVNLPNVIEIKKDAFSNCSALTTVIAPKVEIIGENAFYGCTNLTSLSFPQVKSVGASAFSKCSKLSVLNIQSAKTLGDSFIHETAVSAIVIPNVSEGLNERTFRNTDIQLWGTKGSYLEKWAHENGYTFIDMGVKSFPEGFSPVNDTMYVSVSSVNIRSTPEIIDGNVVGQLRKDQEIQRIASNGEWSLFLYLADKEYRYISNSCLAKYPSTFTPITPTDKTYGDFSYEEHDTYITITKYTGSATNILVPVTINRKPVEELDSIAFIFTEEKAIKSIEAPSVKRIIGDGFLSSCYLLEKISMPLLENIPNGSFYECISLKEVNMPNIKEVGTDVFVCGTFTEMYLTNVEKIADGAFKKSGIKTIHGTVGSFAESWASTNGYGFVDVANDYIPTYPDSTIDASTLKYTDVYKAITSTSKYFGYTGVSIAHDSTGKLYMFVKPWNKYIATPFAQFEDYASELTATRYQTTAAYGNYAWLIASNGNGDFTDTLSVLKTDANSNFSYGTISLGEKRNIQNIVCSFIDENNGKVVICYSEENLNIVVFETKNGGSTWNKVDGQPISSERWNEYFCGADFVTQTIGFVSFRARGQSLPGYQTYITVDGGKTWGLLSAKLPTDVLGEGIAETVGMEYNNGTITLTIVVKRDSESEVLAYEFSSTDNGITWTLLE